MGKYQKILFISLFTFGFIINSNAEEITKFDESITLTDLTKAFFSHPEGQGDFARPGFFDGKGKPHDYKKHNDALKPSQQQKGVNVQALYQVLESFNQYFSSIDKNKDKWFNKNPIDFETNTITVDSRINNTQTTSFNRYAQKITVPTESTVCFMGDYHGSIHSLIRNLWRLVSLGHLNPDLTIKNPEKFYMVFLGDYIDRGRYGVEVIFTVIALKLRNPNNVFMVAGNHETGSIFLRDGFFEELVLKYGNNDDRTNIQDIKKFYKPDTYHHVINTFEQCFNKDITLNTGSTQPFSYNIKDLVSKIFELFFDRLPVALFLTCGDTAVQACHGGIEKSFSPGEFINSKLLYYNLGNEQICRGLFWSDFCQTGDLCEHNDRGAGYKTGQGATQKYLNDNNLKFIFRAHQDQEGILFFHNGKEPQMHEQTNKQSDFFYLPSNEEDGPFRWTDVVKFNNDFNKGVIFPLTQFKHPVVTFSSAIEPRNFPRDNFGLVQAFDTFGKWTLEVCEYYLGKYTQDGSLQENRHGKYPYLGINTTGFGGKTERITTRDTSDPEYQKENTDPIGVKWNSTFDSQQLEKGLEEIIKASLPFSPNSSQGSEQGQTYEEPSDNEQ